MTLINTSLLSLLTNDFFAEKASAHSRWREGGGRVSYSFSPREEEPKQTAEQTETSQSFRRGKFHFLIQTMRRRKTPDFVDVETMLS